MVITINTNGASISPNPRFARDYSQPVQFTLTAPDGTKVVYTVTVKGAECLPSPAPTPVPAPIPTTPTGPALVDIGPLLDHGGNPLDPFHLNALAGFPAVDDFANQTNLSCDTSGICTAIFDLGSSGESVSYQKTFPVTVEVRVPGFTNTLKRPLNIVIENEY